MAAQYSAAGQALGFGADVTGAIPAESEDERKKRLAAIQAATAKVGVGPANGSALSPAGMALGLGGYGSAVGG